MEEDCNTFNFNYKEKSASGLSDHVMNTILNNKDLIKTTIADLVTGELFEENYKPKIISVSEPVKPSVKKDIEEPVKPSATINIPNAGKEVTVTNPSNAQGAAVAA
jgi:hypothetical protein